MTNLVNIYLLCFGYLTRHIDEYNSGANLSLLETHTRTEIHYSQSDKCNKDRRRVVQKRSGQTLSGEERSEMTSQKRQFLEGMSPIRAEVVFWALYMIMS